MANKKLIRKLKERNIIVTFGNGEVAVGFHIRKDEDEIKNMTFCNENLADIKTINKKDWV